MALSEEIINKLKVLIYEDKDSEAIKVLQKENDLSYDEAAGYVNRLKDSLSKGRAKPVKDNSKLMLIIFASVSGLFWMLAIFFYFTKSDQIAKSVLVEGTVTELIQDESGSAPVISYMFENTAYQYISNIFSSPPAYELGEVVELYLLPEAPQEVIINSFADRWLIIMIFGILAVVFDLIAVAALLIKPRSSSADFEFLDKDDGFSRDFD